MCSWGYNSASHGPENWFALSEEYHLCRYGKNQSPIDISSYEKSCDVELSFVYGDTVADIGVSGRFVYSNFCEGSHIHLDNDVYQLIQAHTHIPSEHTLKGERFLAETHLVHENDVGDIAVVALLYKEGDSDLVIETTLSTAEALTSTSTVNTSTSTSTSTSTLTSTSTSTSLAQAQEPSSYHGQVRQVTCVTPMPQRLRSVKACDYTPAKLSYFRYEGSLTTPPCSESVRWFVMDETLTISQEQVERMKTLCGGNNSRPLQPLGERIVHLCGHI